MLVLREFNGQDDPAPSIPDKDNATAGFPPTKNQDGKSLDGQGIQGEVHHTEKPAE
jgi:hypothetical protein